ncbi:MAG: hypothetical protein Q7S55_00400 [Nanoarchaeota archaeon]|nr:hypothetical protein [Nanoarchaeota archaeon]
MGLADKLRGLDEAIWKQYEKGTNYCNEKFGWDKYDLLRIGSASYTGSMFGIEFLFLADRIDHDLAVVAGGAAIGLVSYGVDDLFKIVFENLKQGELKLLEEKGAAIEPQFTPARPTALACYSLLCGVGSYVFSQEMPSVRQSLPTGLMMALGALNILSVASLTYFWDQIMTPPTKKKSVLKTWYEKVMGKVPAVSQLEPTKYTSIDDLVA